MEHFSCLTHLVIQGSLIDVFACPSILMGRENEKVGRERKVASRINQVDGD